MTGLCKFLDWDSDHFNKRIAQVKKPILYRDDFKKVDHWCIKNKIDCIYYLKDIIDSNESNIEESNNFILVDTRVEFKLKIKNLPIEYDCGCELKVRCLKNQIRSELLVISDNNINNTRFYNDTNFESHLVKKMYQIWIKKCCNDPFTTVVIAEDKNKIAGFITLSNSHEGFSTIGIAAIDKNYQRLGIGKRIMNECIQLSHKNKMTAITVTTQLNNIPAVKFYESVGFQVLRKSNWYHKWYI